MHTADDASVNRNGSPDGYDFDMTQKDHGLFGPESVTWKVMADPSAQLGMVSAVLMQALNPNMLILFDKVSANAADPVGRAERTGQFVQTVAFGDTESVERAGKIVRTLHAHAQWTDPVTGTTLKADTPQWLEWTHNTLVYGVLRAAETYGPKLTPAEQDQYVAEQHKAAAVVGLDSRGLASTRTELDSYMESQADMLALTTVAAQGAESLRKLKIEGNPVRAITTFVALEGIVALLPPVGKMLYGIDRSRISEKLAIVATGAALAAARRATPYKKMLAEQLAGASEHPYGKR